MPGRIDRTGGSDGATSVKDRVAHTIAMTINPIVLVPIFFAWVLAGAGWPTRAVVDAVLLATLFLSIAPVVLIVWMVRTGRAETIEVRTRSHRTGPFLVAFLGGITALGWSAVIDWPTGPLVEPLLGCFLLNTALLAAVNTRFKISLHAASVAGFVSMAAWLSVAVVIPALSTILVPLVMWSRVHTGAHTLREVVAGAAYGLTIPIVELEMLQWAGWLTTP